MPYDLAIIGGGPKALAVCTRLRALEATNRLKRSRSIVIIEQADWGANWSGDNGHTRNSARLATPADRDLGFPYDDDSIKFPGLRVALFKYSWRSYLIDTGLYNDWIERASPPPLVQQWAEYLAWAGKNLEGINPNLEITRRTASVGLRKILLNADRSLWLIHFDADEPCEARALLLTGPGEARQMTPAAAPAPGAAPVSAAPAVNPPQAGSQFRSWTSETFYRRKKDVRGVKTAAVIGSGGAAAEAVLHIHQRWPDARITVFGTASSLWTRGASRFEWAAADPAIWKTYLKRQRMDYLARVAQGAISDHVLESVQAIPSGLLAYVSSPVTSLAASAKQIEVRILKSKPIKVDMVVQCLGYDLHKQLALFAVAARRSIRDAVGLVGGVETDDALKRMFATYQKRVRPNLSVSVDGGAKLFWPSAAAIKFGPGFADLTRLGHTAERIVSAI